MLLFSSTTLIKNTLAKPLPLILDYNSEKQNRAKNGSGTKRQSSGYFQLVSKGLWKEKEIT